MDIEIRIKLSNKSWYAEMAPERQRLTKLMLDMLEVFDAADRAELLEELRTRDEVLKQLGR